MENRNESQVTKLKNWLLLGLKIDRVTAFRNLEIADLRSRVSNVESDLGIVLDREKVPGKKYLQYYINDPKHLTV
jgi:hypothetical protein